MKEILIFAGTTEGRRLSEHLTAAGIGHTVCVATEYGEIVLKKHPLVTVHQGRMEQEKIRAFIQNGDYLAVVDATHPYACQVTHNIKAALEGMAVPYFRLCRESTAQQKESNLAKEGSPVTWFETNETCAGALLDTEGNILLTTGSKELSEFCAHEKLKSRIYVRILPSMESLSLCNKQGICGKQIIAMQGPFSVQMNEAMLLQYDISYLVTKESGRAGGYQEKLEAAKKAGVRVFVVGHPDEQGYSFAEVCMELEKLCRKKLFAENKFQIILAGIGMGQEANLTREVHQAIERADILLGAERMLAPYRPKIEKRAIYQAEQIIPYLKEVQKKIGEEDGFLGEIKVVILFSGDSGFYSGCQSLYASLERERKAGGLKATLRILPGISSVSYLAACIGESYQDAGIYSMHGKEVCNLAGRIRKKAKTFLLMSGVKDVNRLGELLLEAGMDTCEVVTGYRLSYEDGQIETHTPKECTELSKEGLYTCFVKNPDAMEQKIIHGIRDAELIRGKVPMTKEEVREVSICKLHLYEKSVVYDVGSGTGSIAVEIAGLSDEIRVYAIEKKPEAIALIRKNKEKFGRQNMTVVEKEAPEGLEELPKATHAFIGGSGGKLAEILQALYRSNPRMRIVINAISLETIGKLKEMLSLYPVEGEEIIQMQVDRAQRTGDYHLMRAENPVWICAFDFAG